MQKIELVIKPQTANSCWKGRKFKTTLYNEWRDEMGWLLRWRKSPIVDCSIELDFYIKHYKVTDVDNLIKPTLDSLQENGVIKNDKYIKSIRATKHKADIEKIVITIHEETHEDLH